MPLGSTPRRPPPPELDEMTLVRAQRGDARARRALVERYQRPVFALLGRMLHGQRRDLIEDVAQDTFLRVFKALATYDRQGPARLSTWILTIASRRAIDELRRRPLAHAPIEDVPEVSSPTSADALAERQMLARLLREAIADLSPEHRAAFLLREYHEMTYEEIAEQLNLDLGTVKSRLSRARAALRRALAETYHDHR
ncbi:MAG: sigma-70 family RNA polymerase sigma factor [Myxococcales bacterium]|nr:sigma-70 family RNA polymerase sigma factor [Myxococcales bacterium]